MEEKIYENFDVMNDIVGEQRRIDRDMNKMRKTVLSCIFLK